MSGEFTQENQVRLKHEEEKEQLRVDEWKVMSQQSMITAVIDPSSVAVSTGRAMKIDADCERLYETVLYSCNILIITGQKSEYGVCTFSSYARIHTVQSINQSVNFLRGLSNGTTARSTGDSQLMSSK